MKMNCKPVLRYEIRNMLLGCAPFYGVIAVLVAATIVSALWYNGNITFSGYAFAAAICIFVFGVVEPRPTMRLCAQMGVSRCSAFIGNLISTVGTSAALAVGGEILFGVGKALGGSKVMLLDVYQLLYVNESMDDLSTVLTLPQHLTSILFNILLLCAFYCIGMFFTFLFWRLSKFWTIVVAVSIPLLLNLIPVGIYRSPVLSHAARALLAWMATSVWNVLAVFVLLAVVFVIFSWLLVRRANIKAPVSK